MNPANNPTKKQIIYESSGKLLHNSPQKINRKYLFSDQLCIRIHGKSINLILQNSFSINNSVPKAEQAKQKIIFCFPPSSSPTTHSAR